MDTLKKLARRLLLQKRKKIRDKIRSKTYRHPKIINHKVY